MAAATADPTTGIMNLAAFSVSSSTKSFSKQTAEVADSIRKFKPYIC